MGERAVAALVGAALVHAGCTQLSAKKIPETPAAVAANHRATVDQWWLPGDPVCPSMEVSRTASGPPGANIVPGRLYGSPPPEGNRIWCAAGVDHGMSTTFHPNGARASQGEYVQGVTQGPWATWHANGQMASYGEFVDGKANGLWEYWSESGAPLQRGVLAGDERTGMWLSWKGDASPGDDPATWVEYDDDGDSKRSGVFIDGEPVQAHGACVMGVAAPECRVILLADLTIRATPNADATSSKSTDTPVSVPFEVGGVFNLTDRHAIGFTAGYNFSDEYAGPVARARYRMWLSRYFGLDVGYGILWRRDDLDAGTGRGSSMFVALSGADLLSLVAEVQRYDAGDGIEYAGFLGLRVGAPVLATMLYILLRVGSKG